ncbi:MAG: serine/threonine-protein kinase [Myxococcota bacterium]
MRDDRIEASRDDRERDDRERDDRERDDRERDDLSGALRDDRGQRPRDELAERCWAAQAEARLFGSSAEPVMLGRFEILRRLGAGGLGIVYAARDRRLGREVALKRMRPEARLPDGDARLLREAQAMARLSHPNVVTVYEAGELEGDVYVAMELVQGRTLRAWAAEAERPWRERLRPLLAAGRGLAAAHQAGLVHRDFKPDNILVRPDGHVVVVDFGLAHGLDGFGGPDELGELDGPVETADTPSASADACTTLTRTGAVLGTPRYMAPEQHAGVATSPASDQYAFCVTTWEALLGAPPFTGQTLGALARAKQDGLLAVPRSRSVPAPILRALARGLEADPQRRWPSMDALLAMLGHDPRRQRWRWGMIAAITLFVGVALTGAVFQAIMFYDYLGAARP